jgi:hypothetical protein
MVRRGVGVIKVERLHSAVKRYAWRLTALACWVYGAIYVCGGGRFLKRLDAALLSAILEILSNLGFAPGRLAFFPAVIGSLWLLFISAFSWSQMAGLTLYVFFGPLTAFLLLRYGKVLEAAREQGRRTASSVRDLTPARPVWTYALIVCLTAWFLLYGDSPLRIPLIAAIFLAGLLFSVRVYRTFVYTALEDPTGMKWIERYSVVVTRQIKRLGDEIKEKKAIDVKSLAISRGWWRRYQRILRFLSRWLYGDAARNRAALIVMFRYMFNLCVVGSLAILFWALMIRYSSGSPMAKVGDSVLASASRLIPGVPEPVSLNYPNWVKAGASVTAWLVFVLYAGPVASLFPSLQERYIRETAKLYTRLRLSRTALYGPLNHLDTVVRLLSERPELQGLVNLVVFLKLHPDLKQLFQGEPEYPRVLKERPDLVQILTGTGLVLPSLDDYPTTSPSSDGTHSVLDSLSSAPTHSETTVPTLKNSGASIGHSNAPRGAGRGYYLWLAFALGAFALFVHVGRNSVEDEGT